MDNFWKPISMIRLNTNSTCNLRCKHCYYIKEVWMNWEIMEFKDAKIILRKLKWYFKDDFKLILMGWWEFFLYPYFYEIIDFLYNEKIDYGIVTNWTLINEEKLIYLKTKNVSDITFSLEWNKEYNDKIRWKWVYDIVVKNIILTKSFWIRSNLDMSLNKDNFKYLLWMMQLCKDLWINMTYSRNLDFNNNSKNIVERVELDKNHYKVLIKIIESQANPNILNFRQENFLNFYFNILKKWNTQIQKIIKEKIKFFNDIKNWIDTKLSNRILYILPNWNTYTSWNLAIDEFKLWNLIKEDTQKVLDLKKMLKIYDPEKLKWKCFLCKYKYLCLWDRWASYWISKDIFAEDPSCPFFD
ncbi:MAG: radical SAM protein [uncultured bacterium (gcode 4)]|uniref:Radical SAM protein n=1 Tax=uncultured bacterium (gcode 4) TaxID=1234023 RepID=K2G9L1_9BACT|nr:MAG: radical SAM protein [uncultured bacterium (gcode 4)]